MLEEIFSDPLKQYIYQQIAAPDEPQVPFSKPFTLLLWGSMRVPAEYRDRVCELLLRAGCRHVFSAGVQANEWDAAADLASVRLWPEDPESDANHVMTSSHEDDTLDELAQFFVLGSSFDFHDFTDFMVLQIGHDAAMQQELVTVVRNWAESETRTRRANSA